MRELSGPVLLKEAKGNHIQSAKQQQNPYMKSWGKKSRKDQGPSVLEAPYTGKVIIPLDGGWSEVWLTGSLGQILCALIFIQI